MRYPLAENRITAGFGWYTVFGSRSMHYGLDLGAVRDGRVMAAHGGRVIMSLFDSAGGNMVAIRGPFCSGYDLLTRYAHLASRAVCEGAQVDEGRVIGMQGNTGARTTGTHLHFETWLIPSASPYRYSLRESCAVDPLGVCKLRADQSFDANGKTCWAPIPDPEPKVALTRIEGVVLTPKSGFELFFVPDNATSPLVAGEGRSRHYSSHIFAQKSYPCLYSAVNCGFEWIGIDTPWGLLWCGRDDSRMELAGLPEAEGHADKDKEAGERPRGGPLPNPVRAAQRLQNMKRR